MTNPIASLAYRIRSVEWWRVFKRSTLDELIATAARRASTCASPASASRARLGIVIGDQFPQTQTVGGSACPPATDGVAFRA